MGGWDSLGVLVGAADGAYVGRNVVGAALVGPYVGPAVGRYQVGGAVFDGAAVVGAAVGTGVGAYDGETVARLGAAEIVGDAVGG